MTKLYKKYQALCLSTPGIRKRKGEVLKLIKESGMSKTRFYELIRQEQQKEVIRRQTLLEVAKYCPDARSCIADLLKHEEIIEY